MAKAIIMSGGAGGASSDECTALKSHILAGKTAVTQDSNDEPAVGTMPERGNWNGSVGMNDSIIVPEGHHGGTGKVTGPVVTQRGAWTSRLGINGKVIIPEGYHNGAGYVDQAIATQGAMTIQPGTTAKTASVAGKYMDGDINVPAISISPSIIKKGQYVILPDGSRIGPGTFEGYIAEQVVLTSANIQNYEHTVLYSQDVNISPSMIQYTTQRNDYRRGLAIRFNIDFTGYREMVIEYASSTNDSGNAKTLYLNLTPSRPADGESWNTNSLLNSYADSGEVIDIWGVRAANLWLTLGTRTSQKNATYQIYNITLKK